jgi:type IV secretory pathway TrbD component
MKKLLIYAALFGVGIWIAKKAAANIQESQQIAIQQQMNQLNEVTR